MLKYEVGVLVVRNEKEREKVFASLEACCDVSLLKHAKSSKIDVTQNIPSYYPVNTPIPLVG